MVDQQPAKFTTYDTSDDGYAGIFEVPDGGFYHHEEVDRAIAQRDQRIAELEAENARMQEKDRAVEALFSLVAADVAIINKVTPDGYWAGFDPNAEGDITFSVRCSDTFAWACADDECFVLLAAPQILELYRDGGWPAVDRWTQDQRGGPEKSPFIQPVQKMARNYDDALERAKRRVAELEAERDALAAWECVSCHARLPDTVRPGMLDGVTRCSACVKSRWAAQRVKEIEAERRWIPIGERLPDRDSHYLVFTTHGCCFASIETAWDGCGSDAKPAWRTWRDADGLTMEPHEVTHWMPLPKPPEEVAHD